MKIAVLEDDAPQAELIAEALTSAGHKCAVYKDARALVAKLRQETFDLLVLDWNVPGMSGLDLVTWARTNLTPPPPILMVTARSDAQDIVVALNSGADDFIVKPIDPAVLVARLHAVLRRTYPAEFGPKAERFGDYDFDPLTQVVRVGGEAIQLTSKEFELALMFFRNLNRPLGRAYLLESLWGRNPDVQTRTLDAHVSRLRLKLGLRPQRGFRLAPVYSYGYRLEWMNEGASSGDDTR